MVRIYPESWRATIASRAEIAIHGATLVVLWQLKLILPESNKSFWQLADLVALSSFRQAIGRWGIFFNWSSFGDPVPLAPGNYSSWSPSSQNMLILPTSIPRFFAQYESLWNLMVSVTADFVFSRLERTTPGKSVHCFWIYLVLLPAWGRQIKGLRTDSLMDRYG